MAGVALATATAALALLVGSSRGAGHATPPPPTDRQIARTAIARYVRFLDAGRGAAFCNSAVTAATLRAQGGADRCVASINAYVEKLEQQGYDAVLLDMHYLFTMLSDGIALHCAAGHACPSTSYGRWASATYPGEVDWRTSSNPRLASSTGAKVVAVVDPSSNTRWITLYYQAWDGRILRARWSTQPKSWRGSVVDTHRGTPFISHVRVLRSQRVGGELVARVGMRVGTRAVTEIFTLRHEAGSWRVDTWGPAPGPPAV